jgi:hypothetical protein
MVYLITVNLSEAVALYRTSWPPYESDGFAIVNLHWSEGELSVNSVKKFPGLKKRAERKVKSSPVFYTLRAEDGVTMKAEYFKAPKNLHYDFFDESTGELKGGQFQRDEFDFAIRVPNLLETEQVMFYRSNRDPRVRPTKQKKLLERVDECESLGEVVF